MKHLKDYLNAIYGHSNIFQIDCSDKEYLKMIGWVQAIEEYESEKQKKALLEAIKQFF